MITTQMKMPRTYRAVSSYSNFENRILDKYRFSRRDYLGMLGLVFKEEAGAVEEPFGRIYQYMVNLRLVLRQQNKRERSFFATKQFVLKHLDKVLLKTARLRETRVTERPDRPLKTSEQPASRRVRLENPPIVHRGRPVTRPDRPARPGVVPDKARVIGAAIAARPAAGAVRKTAAGREESWIHPLSQIHFDYLKPVATDRRPAAGQMSALRALNANVLRRLYRAEQREEIRGLPEAKPGRRRFLESDASMPERRSNAEREMHRAAARRADSSAGISAPGTLIHRTEPAVLEAVVPAPRQSAAQPAQRSESRHSRVPESRTPLSDAGSQPGGKAPLSNAKIWPFGEKTPFSSEKVRPFGAKAPFSDEKVRFSDEKAPFSDEKVRSSDGKTPFLDEKVRFSDGKTPFSDEKVRFSDGKASFSDEKVRSSDGKTPFSDEKVRFSDGKAPFSDEKVRLSNQDVPPSAMAAIGKRLVSSGPNGFPGGIVRVFITELGPDSARAQSEKLKRGSGMWIRTRNPGALSFTVQRSEAEARSFAFDEPRYRKDSTVGFQPSPYANGDGASDFPFVFLNRRSVFARPLYGQTAASAANRMTFRAEGTNGLSRRVIRRRAEQFVQWFGLAADPALISFIHRNERYSGSIAPNITRYLQSAAGLPGAEHGAERMSFMPQASAGLTLSHRRLRPGLPDESFSRPRVGDARLHAVGPDRRAGMRSPNRSVSYPVRPLDGALDRGRRESGADGSGGNVDPGVSGHSQNAVRAAARLMYREQALPRQQGENAAQRRVDPNGAAQVRFDGEPGKLLAARRFLEKITGIRVHSSHSFAPSRHFYHNNFYRAVFRSVYLTDGANRDGFGKMIRRSPWILEPLDSGALHVAGNERQARGGVAQGTDLGLIGERLKQSGPGDMTFFRNVPQLRSDGAAFNEGVVRRRSENRPVAGNAIHGSSRDAFVAGNAAERNAGDRSPVSGRGGMVQGGFEHESVGGGVIRDGFDRSMAAGDGIQRVSGSDSVAGSIVRRSSEGGLAAGGEPRWDAGGPVDLEDRSSQNYAAALSYGFAVQPGPMSRLSFGSMVLRYPINRVLFDSDAQGGTAGKPTAAGNVQRGVAGKSAVGSVVQRGVAGKPAVGSVVQRGVMGKPAVGGGIQRSLIGRLAVESVVRRMAGNVSFLENRLLHRSTRSLIDNGIEGGRPAGSSLPGNGSTATGNIRRGSANGSIGESVNRRGRGSETVGESVVQRGLDSAEAPGNADRRPGEFPPTAIGRMVHRTSADAVSENAIRQEASAANVGGRPISDIDESGAAVEDAARRRAEAAIGRMLSRGGESVPSADSAVDRKAEDAAVGGTIIWGGRESGAAIAAARMVHRRMALEPATGGASHRETGSAAAAGGTVQSGFARRSTAGSKIGHGTRAETVAVRSALLRKPETNSAPGRLNRRGTRNASFVEGGILQKARAISEEVIQRKIKNKMGIAVGGMLRQVAEGGSFSPNASLGRTESAVAAGRWIHRRSGNTAADGITRPEKKTGPTNGSLIQRVLENARKSVGHAIHRASTGKLPVGQRVQRTRANSRTVGRMVQRDSANGPSVGHALQRVSTSGLSAGQRIQRALASGLSAGQMLQRALASGLPAGQTLQRALTSRLPAARMLHRATAGVPFVGHAAQRSLANRPNVVHAVQRTPADMPPAGQRAQRLSADRTSAGRMVQRRPVNGPPVDHAVRRAPANGAAAGHAAQRTPAGRLAVVHAVQRTPADMPPAGQRAQRPTAARPSAVRMVQRRQAGRPTVEQHRAQRASSGRISGRFIHTEPGKGSFGNSIVAGNAIQRSRGLASAGSMQLRKIGGGFAAERMASDFSEYRLAVGNVISHRPAGGSMAGSAVQRSTGSRSAAGSAGQAPTAGSFVANRAKAAGKRSVSPRNGRIQRMAQSFYASQYQNAHVLPAVSELKSRLEGGEGPSGHFAEPLQLRLAPPPPVAGMTADSIGRQPAAWTAKNATAMDLYRPPKPAQAEQQSPLPAIQKPLDLHLGNERFNTGFTVDSKANIDQIVSKVFKEIEKRMKFTQQRRGF